MRLTSPSPAGADAPHDLRDLVERAEPREVPGVMDVSLVIGEHLVEGEVTAGEPPRVDRG